MKDLDDNWHFNGKNVDRTTLNYDSIFDTGKPKTAILNNGSKVEYDMCIKKSDINAEYVKECINFSVFVLLGEGIKYIIDGIEQEFEDICLFYKRK